MLSTAVRIISKIVTFAVVVGFVGFVGFFIMLMVACGGGNIMSALIPAIVVLGLVVYAMVKLLFSKKRKANTTTIPQDQPLSHDGLAILHYVQLALQFGSTTDQVVAELRAKGWPEQQIQGALVLAK